jgi:hypothetical protein
VSGVCGCIRESQHGTPRRTCEEERLWIVDRLDDLVQVFHVEINSEGHAATAALQRLKNAEPRGKRSSDWCHVSGSTRTAVQHDDIGSRPPVASYLNHSLRSGIRHHDVPESHHLAELKGGEALGMCC